MDEFVDIIGYEGLYQINRKGEVYSLYMNKILKPSIKENGYVSICLCKNGKPKHHLVHRLIALNFIPNIDNLPEVHHINEIKTDNRLENLQWVTASKNMVHRSTVKLSNTGYRNIYKTLKGFYRINFRRNKLSYEKVCKVNCIIEDAIKQRDLMLSMFGVLI